MARKQLGTAPAVAADAATKGYVDTTLSTALSGVAGYNNTALTATLGTGAGGTPSQTIPAGFFTTVNLHNIVTDIGNNFDSTTSIYTVPVTGTYLIVARVRVVDGTTANKNVGLGVHTSSVDGPHFVWSGVSAVMRNTFDYQRVAAFTAGDPLRLYVYSDVTATDIADAALSIIRIAGDGSGSGSGSSVVDATSTAKGVIQLSGDLGGTAAAPTVPALATKAPLDSPTFTGTTVFPSPNNVKTAIPANTLITSDPISLIQVPLASMWHDLLAFNRFYTRTFETTADGTTWTAGTLDARLFAHKEAQSITVVQGATTRGARWTFNDVSWSSAAWVVLGVTYSAPNPTKNYLVESSADGVTWTTRHTTTGALVTGSPLWLSISAYNDDAYLRITVMTSALGTGDIALSSIRLLSPRWGDQGLGSEVESPINWTKDRWIGIATGSDPQYPLDVNGNANVAGNLSISGTVDGRDVSNDGTALDTVLNVLGTGRLGLLSQNISSLDLNTITTVGFYRGSAMTNAPGGATDWFYILVESHDDSQWTKQTAHGYTGVYTGRQFTRLRTGGTWGGWSEQAYLASPTFTGTVTIPDQGSTDYSSKAANTKFVWDLLGSGADGINAYTQATANSSTRVATTAFVKAQGYSTLVSPTFTGTPAAPTPATADNSTTIATTAFVKAQSYAPLASPTLTGVPAAPTATAGTSTTQLATTAFVTTADALKANIASPTFTGTPAAPTPTTADNGTTIATTAFVKNQGYAAASSLSTYAPLASPALTGTPTAPTPATADSTTTVATTAFVKAQAYAPLASPTLTGVPAAPTATAGTSTTQLATTAFVTTADNLKANIASPTFTGVPAAPTPATTDNTTTIATTAFVKAQAYAPLASPSFTGNISVTGNVDGRKVSTDGTNLDTVRTTLGTGRLGTASQDISNTDLNSLITTGFYRGTTLTNAPNSDTGWFFVICENHDGVTVKQTAYGFSYRSAGRQFVRYSTSVAWQAWHEFGYLDSPSFTGTPSAPTAPANTNTTQVATTAYVVSRTPQITVGTTAPTTPAVGDLWVDTN